MLQLDSEFPRLVLRREQLIFRAGFHHAWPAIAAALDAIEPQPCAIIAFGVASRRTPPHSLERVWLDLASITRTTNHS